MKHFTASGVVLLYYEYNHSALIGQVTGPVIHCRANCRTVFGGGHWPPSRRAMSLRAACVIRFGTGPRDDKIPFADRGFHFVMRMT